MHKNRINILTLNIVRMHAVYYPNTKITITQNLIRKTINQNRRSCQLKNSKGTNKAMKRKPNNKFFL